MEEVRRGIEIEIARADSGVGCAKGTEAKKKLRKKKKKRIKKEPKAWVAAF